MIISRTKTTWKLAYLWNFNYWRYMYCIMLNVNIKGVNNILDFAEWTFVRCTIASLKLGGSSCFIQLQSFRGRDGNNQILNRRLSGSITACPRLWQPCKSCPPPPSNILLFSLLHHPSSSSKYAQFYFQIICIFGEVVRFHHCLLEVVTSKYCLSSHLKYTLIIFKLLSFKLLKLIQVNVWRGLTRIPWVFHIV